MIDNQEPKNLEQLLERMGRASKDGERVTVRAIFEIVGTKSFAPLLLMAGIVTLAPIIGDIPGVPTIIGGFVVLIAVQLLFQRKHFWLPDWMLNRSVDGDKLCKALDKLRRPARFIDRFLKPRFAVVTGKTGLHAIAVASLLIGAAMPFMEVVPFSANGAGAALTAFGLALIAQDGLLGLVAFGVVGITLGLVVYYGLF